MRKRMQVDMAQKDVLTSWFVYNRDIHFMGNLFPFVLLIIFFGDVK